MFNKKGLSDVVTTVLIILLVLAAVVIIWAFIRPLLSGTGSTIDAQTKCLNADVVPVSCKNTGSNSVIIGKFNNDGATTMKLILVKNDGSTSVDTQSTSSGAGSTVTSTSLANGNQAKEGHVAAVIKDSNNKDYVCPESTVTVACA